MTDPNGAPANRDEELSQLLAGMSPQECDEIGQMAEDMIAEGSHRQ